MQAVTSYVYASHACELGEVRVDVFSWSYFCPRAFCIFRLHYRWSRCSGRSCSHLCFRIAFRTQSFFVPSQLFSNPTLSTRPKSLRFASPLLFSAFLVALRGLFTLVFLWVLAHFHAAIFLSILSWRELVWWSPSRHDAPALWCS